jgi:hypothetical protein
MSDWAYQSLWLFEFVLASIGDLDMKLGSIGALDRWIKWSRSGLQMYWEGTGDDGSSFLYLQL